ncbi:MAG: hypothetical protein LBI30_02480 [Holosporales bacterium]|nr:hypothetical protein [Holosporales bacterium]
MTKSKLRSLHFSYTPLAGSPIRIVNALNKHTDIEARLVNLNALAYKTRVFEEDLLWSENQQEILQLLDKADVIHLHNWVDLVDNKFGIDFGKCLKKGQHVVRQFHTNPERLAKTWGVHLQDIISDPIAQLVLAQFHERYYPRARIVPNIVPIFDQDYLTYHENSGELCKIFFSPTSLRSAWESRWDTKGANETIKIIKNLKKTFDFDFEYVSRRPHKETIVKKRKSDVVIDEVVTGSYHISTLEGLSQGKPTLAYLDQRTISAIYEITGSVSQIPVVNAKLEDLGSIMKRIITDKALRKGLGDYSREWMEKYWDDSHMVQHYVRAYDDLINRPERFAISRFDKKRTWLFTEMLDETWMGRKARWSQFNSTYGFIQKSLWNIKKLKSSMISKIKTLYRSK